jgi:hypothetical protein
VGLLLLMSSSVGVGPNLPTLFRTAKETLCVAALPILILVTF